MEKTFKKHETLFCILIIVAYILVNSYIKANYEFTSSICVIANTILSIILLGLVIALKRTKYYGLTPVKKKDYKRFLFFIPLIVLLSVNLWNGINIDNTPLEIIFYILTMLNIGFLEELIFRGFLFKMMEKDNVKTAIIVSSLTFGIGHIVNLFSGADLIETLIQVCYAISIGFMLVMVFFKSKSLIPCIIFHGIFNALAIFNTNNMMSLYISSIFIIVVASAYAFYIYKKVK